MQENNIFIASGKDIFDLHITQKQTNKGKKCFIPPNRLFNQSGSVCMCGNIIMPEVPTGKRQNEVRENGQSRKEK